MPKWFGALIFKKNYPCSKGHLLGFGGLNPCQDGLGTYAVKIEVQMAFASVKEGVKAYQDVLWHLCTVKIVI